MLSKKTVSQVSPSATRAERRRLCSLLRPPRPRGHAGGAPQLTLHAIGRLLGVSAHTVRRDLAADLTDARAQADGPGRPRRKLQPHHLAFLLSDATLEAWAPLTLAQRAVLFHRRFPEVTITARYLGQLYRQHRIKRKVVRFVKSYPAKRAHRMEAQLIMMRSEVRLALELGCRLVFVDECMFTTATRVGLAFAARGRNIQLQEAAMNNEALAVVGGVSAEGGLESYLIQPRSINSQAFIKFLDNLLGANQGRPLALFMDNCTVHHSKLVTAYLREHNVRVIFNVPYSPQYNPIELYWGLVKNLYRRTKLAATLKARRPNHHQLVTEALLEVEGATIRSICSKITEKRLLNE